MGIFSERLYEFKKIRENCPFKKSSKCRYWDQERDCDFLHCPFYYYKVSPQEKRSLKAKFTDEIRFEINDFELSTKKSVPDLIQEIRSGEPDYFQEVERIDTDSSIDDLMIQISNEFLSEEMRLICQSCGQKITDEKFICVPDPTNLSVNRYYHSKGKCAPRKKGLIFVRKRWLEGRK